jgi:hypothetical protein
MLSICSNYSCAKVRMLIQMSLVFLSCETAGLDLGKQANDQAVNLDFPLFPHICLPFLLLGEREWID